MKLVCFGASNPETIRVVNAVKRADEDFEFLGFLDNDESKWGTTFCGYPVFGGLNEVEALNREGALFCNLITRDCVTRYETTITLVKAGAKLANLLHPDVNIEMVQLGLGNYIQENVILQAGVRVGDNSSIHCGSIVSHETSIGNSVFIAPGCALSGLIVVEDGVFIGTGATVLPRLRIGKWSTIGAGTVIIRDVPPYSVVVENPGRVFKNTRITLEDGRVL